jgi:hypothetical protein
MHSATFGGYVQHGDASIRRRCAVHLTGSVTPGTGTDRLNPFSEALQKPRTLYFENRFGGQWSGPERRLDPGLHIIAENLYLRQIRSDHHLA